MRKIIQSSDKLIKPLNEQVLLVRSISRQATSFGVANQQAFIGEVLYGNVEKHVPLSTLNQILDLRKQAPLHSGFEYRDPNVGCTEVLPGDLFVHLNDPILRYDDFHLANAEPALQLNDAAADADRHRLRASGV